MTTSSTNASGLFVCALVVAFLAAVGAFNALVEYVAWHVGVL